MITKKDNIYGYVYMIVNTVNDKPYIGKTVNINKRMNRHRYNARDGEISHLYNAIRKYGEDKFIYYILEEAYSEKELYDLEIYYIELYDTYRGYGYNQSAGGDGHPSGKEHPWFGRKHTEETKKKIGDAHRNKIVTNETRNRLSESKKGKVKGESNSNSKLKEKDVLEIIDLLNSKKYKQQEIADMYNVSQSAITKIKCGRSWNYLHHLIR